MTSERPWILGLDLGPRSSGALRLARLLRQQLQARVVGVFVCETWLVGLPPGEDASVRLSRRSEAERWLADLNVGAPDAAVDETQIVDEADAESGLALAAQGSAGVIVGRRPPSPETWSRLGRVARRLLRRLPAPVLVVPPEVTDEDLAGPVLLATDLTERSVAAARFAVGLARRLARPLLCVHVAQPRWEETYDPSEPRWAELRRRYREETERSSRTWAGEHCPGAELTVDYGDPIDRVPVLARQMHASLIVVGSGRPGMIERFFAGSTASIVAAVAPCAVAVVPPDTSRS